MNDNQIISIANALPILTPIPRPPDQNAAWVYLASLSARSGRNTQRQVLTVIASWLGGTIDSIEWGNLRYAYTIAIKTHTQEAGYSPASVRKFMSALRGTLKNAWRLGYIGADDYAKAIDLGKVNGTSLPVGRFIPTGEIKAIFDCCLKDGNANGARDAALIAILYGCGLRRAEIVAIDMADYDRKDGAITIHGKRSKQRLAYVSNGTLEALNDWLALRGEAPGPLFLAASKTGKIRPDKRLSSQMVYNTVSKRVLQAGLENFSPHSLRRSFVSSLLDADVDISTVAKLAGHSNVQTTALYDRRPEDTKRQGSKLLEVPYHKREEGKNE